MLYFAKTFFDILQLQILGEPFRVVNRTARGQKGLSYICGADYKAGGSQVKISCFSQEIKKIKDTKNKTGKNKNKIKK